MSAAEVRMLRATSTQMGATFAQMAKAQLGVEEFSQLTTRLEEKWPDGFVRAGVPRAGYSDKFFIQWKGSPSEGVLALVKTLPVDVEIQYGLPASSRELAELSRSLFGTISGQRDVISEAGTRYDPLTRQFTLKYLPAPGVSNEAMTDALNAALRAGATNEARTALPVAVDLEEDPSLEDAHYTVTIAGGRDLRNTAGGGECTFGFTATRNGLNGIITAAHCPNDVIYNNNEYVVGSGQAAPAAYDVQFHRTLAGHSTGRQFRAYNRTQSGDEVVTGVANAPYLSYMCTWGRVTNATSCGYVTTQDVCQTFGPGEGACGVDGMDRLTNTGGDSGGPVFNGGSARGTLTGNAEGRTWFTRVSTISSQLGAIIKQD
ncbi:MAG: hypothetical protein H0X12_13555 [Nocardioides sp.]|nr:hypothetical protein [Nocardioides sp.]